MAWHVIRTEPLATGPNSTAWQIDLLGGETRVIDPATGKVVPLMEAGNTEHGVKASCHKEENRQFEVVAWVPSEQVEAAQTAVLEKARRLIDEAKWEFSRTYEL
jgi:hypothetical protein